MGMASSRTQGERVFLNELERRKEEVGGGHSVFMCGGCSGGRGLKTLDDPENHQLFRLIVSMGISFQGINHSFTCTRCTSCRALYLMLSYYRTVYCLLVCVLFIVMGTGS